MLFNVLRICVFGVRAFNLVLQVFVRFVWGKCGERCFCVCLLRRRSKRLIGCVVSSLIGWFSRVLIGAFSEVLIGWFCLVMLLVVCDPVCCVRCVYAVGMSMCLFIAGFCRLCHASFSSRASLVVPLSRMVVFVQSNL